MLREHFPLFKEIMTDRKLSLPTDGRSDRFIGRLHFQSHVYVYVLGIFTVFSDKFMSIYNLDITLYSRDFIDSVSLKNAEAYDAAKKKKQIGGGKRKKSVEERGMHNLKVT